MILVLATVRCYRFQKCACLIEYYYMTMNRHLQIDGFMYNFAYNTWFFIHIYKYKVKRHYVYKCEVYKWPEVYQLTEKNNVLVCPLCIHHDITRLQLFEIIAVIWAGRGYFPQSLSISNHMQNMRWMCFHQFNWDEIKESRRHIHWDRLFVLEK